MPRLPDLAPDQQAVLALLLAQGKSYDDIAGLLGMEREAVRRRALGAVEALAGGAPGGDELPAPRRAELADHLLGQQSGPETRATSRFLDGSPAGRAWARAAADELRPIAGDGLPAVPDEPPGDAPPAPVAAGAGRGTPEPAGQATGSAVAPAGGAARSSRLGGLVLLAVVALVAVAGLVLLLRGGDDAGAGTTASSPAASGTTAASAVPDQQVNLAAPKGSSSKALGVALIQQGGLAFQVQGLPQSNTYRVWLWNSRTDALPLGYANYLKATKRVAGSVPSLPEEAAGYASLILTREPARPTETPGPIVQIGAIKQR